MPTAKRAELKIHGLLLDMDGVLYHGSKRLAGAVEVVNWLHNNAIPYLFLTNNSSRTPQQVVEKLNSMGIPATPSRILSSSMAVAETLKPPARIYMIGEDGLRVALEEKGFLLTAENPEYVVVGLDRTFNEDKLMTAAKAIQNGATFVATNLDPVLLNETGTERGTGTIVKMVEVASNHRPDMVVGKPERGIFEMAAKLLQCDFSKLTMLGDNLDTDIRGAQNVGMTAILVMSGITTPAMLAASTIKPDYVVEHLSEFLHIANPRTV